MKKFDEVYSGKVEAAADYLLGRAKNRSAEGAFDGTPWEKILINDALLGPLAAILSEAGIIPNGSDEKEGQSQVLDAIKLIIRDQQWGDRFKGSFAKGFTYTNSDDVGRGQDGEYYKYIGSDPFPKIISAGVNPSGDLDFEVVVFGSASSINNSDNTTSQDTHNTVKAILVSQGLSGEYGYFAGGFTINDPFDVGIDASYQFWKYTGAETLPYAVPQGTDPSAGDWDIFNLDSLYVRRFNSFTEMAEYTGHIEGNEYTTGLTNWSVENSGDYDLGDGLFLIAKGSVYASDFSENLNDAITEISTIFNRRIEVVADDLMKITDTVNFGIDCDLKADNLILANDLTLKPIFTCVNGWSGTTTPCVVFGNNYKALRGFDLTGENYKDITINNLEFRDVGNKDLDTSDSSWIGFYVHNRNCGNIELINPTSRNIYVKPDTIIGNAAGSCRNIVITGQINSSDTPTNINIKGHTSVDLFTEEDSDALVVEATTLDLANVVLNVDIYDGYSHNCQKRMYKFQTESSPTYTVSGIRLHGDSYANAGDSVKAISPLSVQKGIVLDANATITYEGLWTYGLDADDCSITGELNLQAKAVNTADIGGNTPRGLFLRNNASVKMNNFTGYGHELCMTVETGSTLQFNKVDVSGNSYFGSIAGKVQGRYINCISSGDKDLSAFNGSITITGEVEILEYCNIDNTGNTNPPVHNYRIVSALPVSITRPIGSGASLLAISINSSSGDIELLKPKSDYGNACVRFTGASNNVYIEAGQHPTAVSVIASGSSVANLISVNERLY